MSSDRSPACPTCGSDDVAVRLAGCRGQQWELDVDPWHFNLPGYPGHREAPRTDRTPADPPRCGHHGNELTDIPGHGLRCPWCFPEFFPEHRFLVKFAELEAFADAAGFRVVPIPDDNTRALAARLRDDADRYEDTARKMGPLGWGWQRQADDLRDAAALLDGQQDQPDRPT